MNKTTKRQTDKLTFFWGSLSRTAHISVVPPRGKNYYCDNGGYTVYPHLRATSDKADALRSKSGQFFFSA